MTTTKRCVLRPYGSVLGFTSTTKDMRPVRQTKSLLYPICPAMPIQKRPYRFFYGQVWHQLGRQKWFSCDWIKFSHLNCQAQDQEHKLTNPMENKDEMREAKQIYLLQMLKDHSPLICKPTRSNNRVTKNIKTNFTTQVIGNLEILLVLKVNKTYLLTKGEND